MAEQTSYGVFYRSNGRLTKTPYLGEVYTETSLNDYFTNYFEDDKRTLKTKIYIRKLRNGKRH